MPIPFPCTSLPLLSISSLREAGNLGAERRAPLLSALLHPRKRQESQRKAAGNVYLAKAEAPLTPIASIAAGTAAFSASATTAGYIPTAFTSFATKRIAPTVVTFSGTATCTAEKPAAELACPIQILIDGQSTGKVNFAPATASSEAAKAAALVHTVTQTTVLGKGGHTVAIQYAGAAKVTFTLKSWNLAVQAYPQPPEAPASAETGK